MQGQLLRAADEATIALAVFRAVAAARAEDKGNEDKEVGTDVHGGGGLLFVKPAEEFVLHGAAAHGAFAVADDDDDVVAPAFGADVAGEAAHVVDGTGFADDATGEHFAPVAFAQGAAFAGDGE